MSSLEFMLAKEYQKNMKIPREFLGKEELFAPVGWLASEKLDGYRARYNPETNSFWSRQNKPYNAPQWFIDIMPAFHLDGELFCGRDGFQKMGAVRKKVPVDEDWFSIKFYVYDAPEHDGEFYDRYEALVEIVKQVEKYWKSYKKNLDSRFKNVTCPIVLTKHHEVESVEHMEAFYKDILNMGGEGIMLKNPWSEYTGKRSNDLLKYKPVLDAEAIIVDYKPGTGKYKGMLGAFICKPLINKGNYQVIDKDENHEFATSGMDDVIRNSYKSTHPIGTIITIEYTSFTDTGKFRFARYSRIREDVDLRDEEEEMDICDSDEKLKNCIKVFEALHKYERANGEGFKASAYMKAVKALKNMNNDCDVTPENLLKVKGVGQKIVDKAMQIMTTGTCPMYDSIKDKKDPREEFLKIHGVGSVKAKQIANMGITSIEELRNHMEVDEILNDTQKIGLNWFEDINERIPREEIIFHENFLKQTLNNIDPTAELTITGSYRRGKMDSGDIDVLIKTPSVKNTSVYEKFLDTLFTIHEFHNGNGCPYMYETLSRGKKKFMGICKINNGIGRRIDIMFTKPEEYPFAILYFTGSMEFNVKMRSELLERGKKLNEYHLKDALTNKVIPHNCITENDVFKFLGYKYVSPKNR